MKTERFSKTRDADNSSASRKDDAVVKPSGLIYKEYGRYIEMDEEMEARWEEHKDEGKEELDDATNC